MIQVFEVYMDSSQHLECGDSLHKHAADVVHGSAITSNIEELTPRKIDRKSTKSFGYPFDQTPPATRFHLRSALSNNTLKVNLTPRPISRQSLQTSSPNEPSPGQKRLLRDFDTEQPQKSPKRQYSQPRIDKDHLKYSNNGPHYVLGPHGEPPPSGIPPRPSKFQEGSMNDRVSKPPPGAIIGPDMIEPDIMDMEIDVKSTIQSCSIANSAAGDTPRTLATYNFNTATRSWNPFRFIGNLFSRDSDGRNLTTPTRVPLSSDDVAKQVEAHMQGLEDRILTRLIALKTGERESQPRSAESTNRVQILDSQQDSVSSVINSTTLSPLLRGRGDVTAIQHSSPFLPIPQIETVTVHPAHLQQIDTTGHASFRNRFSMNHRSPAKAKKNVHGSVSPLKSHAARLSQIFGNRESKHEIESMKWDESGSFHTLKDQIHDESTIAQSHRISCDGPLHWESTDPDMPSKAFPEPPRLRNKASQQLKKMASKMNLRTRKPKYEDSIFVDKYVHQVIRKKTKDQLVKDYLVLQREKQVLEKQLSERVTAEMKLSATNINSPEGQRERDMASAAKPLVLLDTTIPDFRIKEKDTYYPEGDDQEQTGNKQQMTMVARPHMPELSPLKLVDDEKIELSRSHPIHTLQEVAEGLEDSGDSATRKGVDGNSTIVTSVPRVPVKYRSKVPKPARQAKSREDIRKEAGWKGWDEDIF